MKVKRLEIQGFKSFKDKTVVHFDHSITGIVGPNGCGKSNIVDAFFWVMGEQSYKHMRGNSSDDLIFNGSSKYSPLGMAEATLVLETDGVDQGLDIASGATYQDIPLHLKTKEISVTRRLYRSGEGEYLINGTQARLKDIQELFMDTGVGAKGYSVIEQGQIGKIVNAKPEERRLLIEEAAGIAKYKARKKESLRKMEATQANLSRLTDIIKEIEKSLDSLDRQAQKARQYRKYKDELTHKEMTWGRRKSAILHQKVEALRKQKEHLEQELVELKGQLQISENSIEVDRVDLVTETKEAEDLQLRVQDIAGDLSHEKSALELSRRRQGDLTSQLEGLELEQEELQASIESDIQKLEEQENQKTEAELLFQEAANEVREMSQALHAIKKEVDEARSKLEQFQKELMSSVHRSSDLTSKTAALTSKAESARLHASRLAEQTEVHNEKLATVGEELEKAKQASAELDEKRQILQAQRKQKTSALQEEEQEVRQLQKAAEQSLRSVTQLKSKLHSLEELDHSHEGLADGPKAIFDWAKSNGKSDQITALTDILQLKAGFETTLESLLESKIESLVTTQTDLVFPLIEKIKQEKQGRVTLQLSSSIRPTTQAPKKSDSSQLMKLLETHGFKVLNEFSQLVSWDPAYSSFLEPLFHQVYLIESFEPLSSFLQKGLEEITSAFTLVSQDGVVFESQGIIRGGNSKASGAIGILRRKHLIEELRVQVTELESQQEQVEEKVEEAKQALEISKATANDLQTELQSLEIQSAGTQRDVHQMERALREAQNHLNALLKDSENMRLETERATTDRERFEADLEKILSNRAEIEENIAKFEKDLSEKVDKYDEQDSDLQMRRVREASLKERSVSLKRENEATRSLKSDRERRLHEVRRTLDRATREHDEFSGGEDELAEKIANLTFDLAANREKLAQVKDRIEKANAKVNATLEKIKVLHKTGDHKTAQENQLALEVEKFSSELAHLVINLEEKYGPGCLNLAPPQTDTQETQGATQNAQDAAQDPSAVSAEPPSSIPAELTAEEELALGEDVERLRERIRRLGEVNVMAIEEFEQLKKRYDHLLSEKQDLEHSLENLQSAIEHINKTSEERFKKAFEAIASRFERLFPIIFGGGQAKLSLVYPEGTQEILDAGVDILAQPPGKKVANITLLSGGEKALTAVSLIFAIFMVKPSPFCVLDEVDAPLDDANIGKFNALLREMSVKSQFILITHNKKTMELNDTLYGVTMEEPGVSKMISIEMQ